MISLPEFAGYSDDGRYTLMRGLMIASAASDLQIRISVEPDLLQLTHEVRHVLDRVKIPAHVKSAKFQNALVPQLRLLCIRRNKHRVFVSPSLDLILN